MLDQRTLMIIGTLIRCCMLLLGLDLVCFCFVQSNNSLEQTVATLQEDIAELKRLSDMFELQRHSP